MFWFPFFVGLFLFITSTISSSSGLLLAVEQATATSLVSDDNTKKPEVDEEEVFDKCAICIDYLEGIFLDERKTHQSPTYFDGLQRTMQLPNCRHLFHRVCWQNFLDSSFSKKECPICRAKLEVEPVDDREEWYYNDNTLDMLESNCQDEANNLCELSHSLLRRYSGRKSKKCRNNFK